MREALGEVLINGDPCHIRFAYMHRTNASELFGILEACGYEDALRHLGSSFMIRKIALPYYEIVDAMYDSEKTWEIVAKAFCDELIDKCETDQ